MTNTQQIDELFEFIEHKYKKLQIDSGKILTLSETATWLEGQFENNTLVKKLSQDFSSADKKKTLDKIRNKFHISEEDEKNIVGSILSINEQIKRTPWYQKFKSEKNEHGRNINMMYFTERFMSYLEGHKKIPWHSVNYTNQHTDSIIDRCGHPDPKLLGFSKKGLVIGQVQAGKTLNYSMLVNKAADVGYKVIIILTGMTESLRKQTQERLETDFVGFSDGKELDIVKYGETLFPEIVTASKTPEIITTRSVDFIKAATNHIDPLNPRENPMVIVSKKNISVLKSIFSVFYKEKYDEIKNIKTTSSDNIKTVVSNKKIEAKIKHLPLLFIDDEADYASINTKDPEQDPSAINGIIRDILAMFRQKSYVAYTATPYANIFVDPFDKEDKELINDDLFPSSFIDYIQPPEEMYMGYKKYFYNADTDKTKPQLLSPSNLSQNYFIEKIKNKKYLSIINENDFETLMPLKHKKEHEIRELPSSLKHAIRIFIITRAIQVREKFKKNNDSPDGGVHHTMIINVSRFVLVQGRVFEKVSEYFNDLKNALRVSLDNNASPHLIDMKKSFELEFLEEDNVKHTFDDLRKLLFDAMKNIAIVTTNNENKGELNYDKPDYIDSGRQVIVIGGIQLSRGLTLEGLTTSYVLRNSGTYDTLMQMARWFGYRKSPKDYEFLCRVYIPEASFLHYHAVSKNNDHLNDQVINMVENNGSPLNFGLMVRQSPTGILITARNKMRSAQKNFVLRENYSQRQIFIHYLNNNKEINSKNILNTEIFINNLKKTYKDKKHKNKYYYYENVDGKLIFDLIEKKLTFHPEQIDTRKVDTESGKLTLLGNYISERINMSGELSKWDVAIPFSTKNEEYKFAEYNMKLRSRGTGGSDSQMLQFDADYIKFRKQAFTEPEDITVGFAENYNDIDNKSFFKENRKKPLLLICLMWLPKEDTRIKISKNDQYSFAGPLISYSIVFNKTNISKDSKIKATANAVFQQNQSQLDLNFHDFNEDDEN